MKNALTILVLEDEMIVAENIAAIIENIGDFSVQITNNLEEAIQIVSEKNVSLIVSDINLTDNLNGIEIVKCLQQKYWIPVIYLTAYSNEDYIDSALETEPISYLIKPFTTRQLEVAVNIAMKVIDVRSTSPNYIKPSDREIEILTLLSTGLNSKAIANSLYLSEHTIKTHRKNLMRKYNMKSSSELIALASKLKWV
ncbi:DNA-binding response regulator [Flavobacterium gawalongense]|uniref:Response regulator transcription factor n=1 Tax=Flavobacterium gawalongense TaxID=2594432 RepID=A0A553BUD9_9FLAO|nr:DNA-binding response regulator [Flavobacterium gawalongense]TRX02422.1 response regulator transcription factor [Flavobacterium gawalongense]TRX07749.1 response regulator transcription factor [Flavobacterium gawalongense]TRX11877.1 response regulator transcription factor [Flavobacterium gawalongense]TRX13057.1 response regulator transcription factor [Flavobacterium gawalongense]TRX30974.1 response regulator transcription factor [Flavobacterium gawalongense]